MKTSRSERAIQWFIVIFLSIFAFLCLFPFYNSVILSLNDGKDALTGGIYFWPRQFTLKNYELIFSDVAVYRAYGITIARTLVGTVASVFVTSIFAYSMTKKQLIGRKIYMTMCIITMYFGGGLIPTYLLMRTLHLRDSFWIFIIPGLVSVWNMIIFRSFFLQIPESLEESARIDGCNYLRTFFKIIVPVSKPVYASLGLFSAIGHWNDWFTASIYINNKNLFPMQSLLNQKINASNAAEQILAMSGSGMAAEYFNGITTKSVILTTMVIATVPIIIIYPFLQKHFTKGMFLGSVKG